MGLRRLVGGGAEIARRAVGGRVCYGAASGGHSWQGGRVIKIMVGLTAGAPTVARRGRVCGGRERTSNLRRTGAGAVWALFLGPYRRRR